MSFSTAAKLAAQGEFAPAALWWGRRPLYRRDDLRAWAEARSRLTKEHALSGFWTVITAMRRRLSHVASNRSKEPVKRNAAPLGTAFALFAGSGRSQRKGPENQLALRVRFDSLLIHLPTSGCQQLSRDAE